MSALPITGLYAERGQGNFIEYVPHALIVIGVASILSIYRFGALQSV